MPKLGKYRIKNQLSCLIFVNLALIPIQVDFKSESMFFLGTWSLFKSKHNLKSTYLIFKSSLARNKSLQ